MRLSTAILGIEEVEERMAAARKQRGKAEASNHKSKSAHWIRQAEANELKANDLIYRIEEAACRCKRIRRWLDENWW